MQKLAVVFFPKINLTKIEKIRKRYDPNWCIIPPHITIVSPISNIFEDQFIEHIEKIAKQFKSFSISFNGLSRSTIGNYLFLQAEKGNEEIINLYNKLYSGILTRFKQNDIPFDPHITLGLFQTKDNKFDDMMFSKVYSEAQDINFNITCDFDSISIIKGDEINPAIIIKIVSLLSV